MQKIFAIKNISTTLIILIFLYLPRPVFAAFYKQNCQFQKLGWNFYCDPKRIEEEKADIAQPKSSPSESQAELATKEVERIKKDHDTLLNTAIIYPTEENIKKYLAFNMENLDRSSFFAESAQRLIWQTPDLNYSLKRPVNNVGKRTWIDEKNKKQKDAVLELNQRYGVFFFYRSDCPYCHAYSPVLKNFAERYNIEIKAISLDGRKLAEWPNSIIDHGQATKLGITTVPATILFDNQTQNIIPVGYGALSQEELLEQIYTLTKTKPGENL